MAIKPIARYMLLCDDWRVDTDSNLRLCIDGLITNLWSTDDPPYPLLYRELCVFLILTECRGSANGRVVCIFDETEERIFQTPERRIEFGNDPLDTVGVPFRIRDCWFPRSGVYSMQFWYDGSLVAEVPLRMR